jgi:phage baseplate assembly protein W
VTNIGVPFSIDGRGRTALTDGATHLLEMLELLLFTSPGERVNRPDFGGGIRGLVFAGNSPELAAALRFNLQANLQRWLGDLLEIADLQTEADDVVLRVNLQYRMRGNPQVQTVQFQKPV